MKITLFILCLIASLVALYLWGATGHSTCLGIPLVALIFALMLLGFDVVTID